MITIIVTITFVINSCVARPPWSQDVAPPMPSLQEMLRLEIGHQSPAAALAASTQLPPDIGGVPLALPQADAGRGNYYRFWPELDPLPAWMLLKDGQEFCRVCHKFATGPHLESWRHRRLLAAFAASPWDLDAPVGDPAALPFADWATDHPPAAWGDPDHFEFRGGAAKWWCRLCWKYVDDWHVRTARHVRYARNPGVRLGFADDVAFPAAHTASAEGVGAGADTYLGVRIAASPRLPAPWGPAFELPPGGVPAVSGSALAGATPQVPPATAAVSSHGHSGGGTSHRPLVLATEDF